MKLPDGDIVDITDMEGDKLKKSEIKTSKFYQANSKNSYLEKEAYVINNPYDIGLEVLKTRNSNVENQQKYDKDDKDLPLEVTNHFNEYRHTTENQILDGNHINGDTSLKYQSNEDDVELVWKDVQIFTIPKNKNDQKNVKFVLNKVSGKIRSGECLAIIGASGAGKTTLLNYLSKKIQTKNLVMEGEYNINGQPVKPHLFNFISAYVMQDDILEASLTPLETFMFTAKLKLQLTGLEIEERVRKMIQDLHLTKCQHTRIGSVIKRGVSGGERKRTSIGVELISDPKIIFLDEPTTGLDSYNAYEVISLLRKLSMQGKVVIFTIHQPSSEIFYLLDRLCILALGKTVYFGPSEKCFDHFESINLPVPSLYNPFEHFMEITNITTVENPKILSLYPELESIENLGQRYEKYVDILNTKFEEKKFLFIEDKSEIRKMTHENLEYFESKSIRKNIFKEIGLLVGRAIIINLRNARVLYLKIIQSLITAVLIAALFVRVRKKILFYYLLSQFLLYLYS
jgi:ABC-type multidrug transport system ATPase subunit